MGASRTETPAHQPAAQFSIMPVNRKKRICHERKVIFLGSAGVGKSTLVSALSKGATDSSNAQNGALGVGSPHVDYSTRMAEVHGEIVKLQLWDTADQEKHGARVLPNSYYRHARVAVLVFDVNSRQSFRDLARRWTTELGSFHGGESLGVVVVANRIADKSARRVSTIEGQCLARLLQAQYLECSAAGPSAELCLRGIVAAMEDPRPLTVDCTALGALTAEPVPLDDCTSDSETASEVSDDDDSMLESDDDCEPLVDESISASSEMPEIASTFISIDPLLLLQATAPSHFPSTPAIRPPTHRVGFRGDRRQSSQLELAEFSQALLAGKAARRRLRRVALFGGCALLAVCPALLFLQQGAVASASDLVTMAVRPLVSLAMASNFAMAD